MSVRDQAIEAIRQLPESADVQQVMREVAFLAGIEQALEECDRGETMTSSEAKERLKKCLTK